jgi:hypothetical protein
MSDTWVIVWSAVGAIAGIIVVIFGILMVVKPPPKKPDRVWHLMPAFGGDRTMSCCGRTPEEVPIYDMLTPKPEQVTCGRIGTAQRPKRAA